MRFPVRAILFSCCVLVAGCSRESGYRAVVRDQAAAYEEMTEILRTIKDEASMAAAGDQLAQRQREFAAIAARAKGLGRPSAEVEERLRDEVSKLSLEFSRYQSERNRVRGLPGGAAFLESLEFGHSTR